MAKKARKKAKEKAEFKALMREMDPPDNYSAQQKAVLWQTELDQLKTIDKKVKSGESFTDGERWLYQKCGGRTTALRERIKYVEGQLKSPVVSYHREEMRRSA